MSSPSPSVPGTLQRTRKGQGCWVKTVLRNCALFSFRQPMHAGGTVGLFEPEGRDARVCEIHPVATVETGRGTTPCDGAGTGSLMYDVPPRAGRLVAGVTARVDPIQGDPSGPVSPTQQASTYRRSASGPFVRCFAYLPSSRPTLLTTPTHHPSPPQLLIDTRLRNRPPANRGMSVRSSQTHRVRKRDTESKISLKYCGPRTGMAMVLGRVELIRARHGGVRASSPS